MTIPRVGRILPAATLLISLSASAPALADIDDSLKCDQLTFNVAFLPGQQASYHLVGWLCSRGALANKTLQVLVHGATYNHTYWDWPVQPDHYSYVRYATEAGYATLAIDRLGDGASDIPDPFQLTTAANAFHLHQVVQALRSGQMSSPDFPTINPSKIILVGHSVGAFTSAAEAAWYGDVDGFINTGFLHNVGPGQTASLSLLYPVQFDPAFQSRSYPFGYLTTVPGSRGDLFYWLPGADPAVVAYDEQTKDTVTVGEFSDLTSLEPLTQDIHVPVFLVVGDYDDLFCTPPSCSQTNSLASEPSSYPPDACLQTLVLSNAGHDINLHKVAPTWFAAAQTWADQYVGKNADKPATTSCK